MSTPVIESIAADLKTSIEAITVLNGYNQTLTAVRMSRVAFDLAAAADKNVLIVQESAEVVEEKAIKSETWDQSFALVALVIDPDGSTASIDTRINQIASDIEKKLKATYTRGGYAIDTKMGTRQPFYDNGGRTTGVVVNIKIQYRTQYLDPYTVL